MKLFLAEGFIQELNTDKKVVYNDKLTDEKLSLIRGLCVVKYMARQGVNMLLKEADEFCGLEYGIVLPPPVSLVQFFLQTNIDKVVNTNLKYKEDDFTDSNASMKHPHVKPSSFVPPSPLCTSQLAVRLGELS